MTVLAATAGLADELALGTIDIVARGLTVGNLRLTNVGLHLELAEQTVHDDLQVQLAHAGDDGLAGLVVGAHLEGRVLLGELGEREAHLVLLGLGLGLDGDVDNRIGELHGLEDDLVALLAESVAGGGVLKTHGGEDVAGEGAVDVNAVVRVHLEDAAEALALTVGGVDHVGAGLNVTGVHAEEGELTHVGVGHDLEGERGEGLVVIGLAHVLLAGVGVGAVHGRDVERAREVIDDGVEELRAHPCSCTQSPARTGLSSLASTPGADGRP